MYLNRLFFYIYYIVGEIFIGKIWFNFNIFLLFYSVSFLWDSRIGIAQISDIEKDWKLWGLFVCAASILYLFSTSRSKGNVMIKMRRYLNCKFTSHATFNFVSNKLQIN